MNVFQLHDNSLSLAVFPDGTSSKDDTGWSSLNAPEVVLEDVMIDQNQYPYQYTDGGAQITNLVDTCFDETLDDPLEFSSENMCPQFLFDDLLEHESLSTQHLQSNIDQVAQNTDPRNASQPQYSSVRQSTDENTNSCKLCNCKMSGCLKLYCECFAAGIYCEACCACENCLNKPDYEDFVLEKRQKIETRNPLAFAPPTIRAQGDGTTNTPSARHKRGCKCKRSKCLKKYCECYRSKVGCSDGCHCENCHNSFGKRSEPRFQGVEQWKNQSHEMPNTEQVMSVVTANQFPTIWEDVNHLTVTTQPQSMVVPSLTSHDTWDIQNDSLAESEKDTNIQWYFSANQPCLNKVSDEFHSFFDDINELMGDDSPDFFMGNSTPTNTLKSGSPNQKRVSPPKFQSNQFGSYFQPGPPTARKLVLHTSCFPTPTWCNTEDHTNLSENDHQGNNHKH